MELKPCPFCGTKIVSIEVDGLYRYVQCGNMDCQASGKVFTFLVDAGNANHIVANNWNNRPIEDDLLEAAKAALCRLKEYNYSAMEPTIAKLEAVIAKAEGEK